MLVFWWCKSGKRWCDFLFTPFRLKVVCVFCGTVETNDSQHMANKHFLRLVKYDLSSYPDDLGRENLMWRFFGLKLILEKKYDVGWPAICWGCLSGLFGALQGTLKNVWRTCSCFVFLFTPSMNCYLCCYLFNCFVYVLPGDFMCVCVAIFNWLRILPSGH